MCIRDRYEIVHLIAKETMFVLQELPFTMVCNQEDQVPIVPIFNNGQSFQAVRDLTLVWDVQLEHLALP